LERWVFVFEIEIVYQERNMDEVRGYVTIPVDPETYQMVRRIAEIRGLGRRGNGAVVRQAVRAEYQKLVPEQAMEIGQGKADPEPVIPGG
jgi:hypothetical protein